LAVARPIASSADDGPRKLQHFAAFGPKKNRSAATYASLDNINAELVVYGRSLPPSHWHRINSPAMVEEVAREIIGWWKRNESDAQPLCSFSTNPTSRFTDGRRIGKARAIFGGIRVGLPCAS